VLLLLQKQGIIKLREGIDPLTGTNATPIDITENPKKWKFVEIDAAQLPRTLDDLDASAVNADYAAKAGLNPARDSLLVESGDSPYACLIAVRDKDRAQPWLGRLVQAYQSPEVKRYIETEFKGGFWRLGERDRYCRTLICFDGAAKVFEARQRRESGPYSEVPAHVHMRPVQRSREEFAHVIFPQALAGS
jgi:hypothetical protein